MKFRRDLILAALATFCLTSTPFMVVTSRSADSPNWNPWADMNDDSKVDIFDAIQLSNAFGSSGETPKNVNVTNWPAPSYTITAKGSINVTAAVINYFVPTFFCGGYSRLSLLMYGAGENPPGIVGHVTVYLHDILWIEDANLLNPNEAEELIAPNICNISGLGPGPTFTTEIKAPYCSLQFYTILDNPPAGWWLTISYCVYLRNE